MNRQTEHRSRSAADAGLVVRAAPGGNQPPTFFGHAAVTSTRTAIGDPLTWGFIEEVAPGAFDRTLTTADVRMLIDHNSALIVSRQSAGDLRLDVDDIGLAVDSDLDQELSYVRDFSRNVQTRRITGMSFGFMVPAGGDDWSSVDIKAQDEKGKTYTTKVDLRTITDLDLIEVSGVTFPAYEETDAALRAMAATNPGLLKRREKLISQAGPAVLDKRLVGRALDLMQELRAGKVLSQANIDLLQNVLDQLAAADALFDPYADAAAAVDAALDQAQADISGLLGVANPDPPDPDDGADDGQRSKPGSPVPPADYMRAFAIRHGQRLTT